MSFEQFQGEDGKNIINITVQKNDNEIPKQNAENIINITVGKDDNGIQRQNPENMINIKVGNNDNGIQRQNPVNYPGNFTNQAVQYNVPNAPIEQRQEVLSPVMYDQSRNYEEVNRYPEYYDDQYKKYQYYLLGGILFALILLIVLITLYNKGF